MKHQQSILRKWVVKGYLWATELLYHRLAWAYDFVAWLVSLGNWSRWRLDALKYLKPGNILETGFGTGSLLIEMSERKYDVIGLEPSPEMQRVTSRKLNRKGQTIKRLRGRTEAIPFSSFSFANVISTFPSGYIVQDETLKEIHRILQQEGRLVVVGLGVRNKSGLMQWLTKWFLEDMDDVLVQQLSAKAERIGFKPTRIRHETDTYSLPVLILERSDDE